MRTTLHSIIAYPKAKRKTQNINKELICGDTTFKTGVVSMRIVRTAALFLAVAYLGIHNGQLALFRGGKPHPEIIYPLQVQMLPVSDQKQLQQGIIIQDRLQLSLLLEDYLS